MPTPLLPIRERAMDPLPKPRELWVPRLRAEDVVLNTTQCLSEAGVKTLSHFWRADKGDTMVSKRYSVGPLITVLQLIYSTACWPVTPCRWSSSCA